MSPFVVSGLPSQQLSEVCGVANGDQFAAWFLAYHPTPWRWEMVSPDVPCPDCGEIGCGYEAEPVVFDAKGEEILDTRGCDWGPSGRYAFADFLVAQINERYPTISPRVGEKRVHPDIGAIECCALSGDGWIRYKTVLPSSVASGGCSSEEWAKYEPVQEAAVAG